MSEFAESSGGLLGLVAVVAVIGVAAYWAFGPQAVGLPAMIGAFALWGLISLVSDTGLGGVGILVIVGGVIAVLLIIGMAMRLGDNPPTRSEKDRTGDDS